MEEIKTFRYGFINREYVNLGEAPYKNVVKTVVTQARLAEPLIILQQKDGWYEVERSDGYRGYVSPLDLVLANKKEWEYYQATKQVLVTKPFTFIYKDYVSSPQWEDALSLRSAATIGTQLSLVSEEDDCFRVVLPDGQLGVVAKGEAVVIPRFNSIPLGASTDVVEMAKQFLGLPYYWGGTTSYGFDCSGFVQTICKMNGIHLLRDAHQQYEMGQSVAKDELEVGDLVFWSTYRAGASHVGFYIGDSCYIHAGSSKGVAINSFNPAHDNYSEELDKKYLGSRRVM
ncbi:MAG: C40 family peptidase [bacterium]|nr:C40 family peptidase [bacterium]